MSGEIYSRVALLKEAGNSAFKCGRHAQALNAWGVALRLVEQTEDTKMKAAAAVLYQNRCILHYRRRDFTSCIADASACLALMSSATDSSKRMKALYNRALSFFKVGNLSRSKIDILEFLRYAPEDKHGQNLLRKIEAKQKDTKRGRLAETNEVVKEGMGEKNPPAIIIIGSMGDQHHALSEQLLNYDRMLAGESTAPGQEKADIVDAGSGFYVSLQKSLSIDNKYYNAKVDILSADVCEDWINAKMICTAAKGYTVGAVIVACTKQSDALALGLLADQVCRELEPDILLCVSIVEKNESTLPTVNTEFPSESVVVDQDMSPIDGHAEREKRGIPRIVEALHSASWSRMEFKTQHRPIDTESKMNDNEPSGASLCFCGKGSSRISKQICGAPNGPSLALKLENKYYSATIRANCQDGERPSSFVFRTDCQACICVADLTSSSSSSSSSSLSSSSAAAAVGSVSRAALLQGAKEWAEAADSSGIEKVFIAIIHNGANLSAAEQGQFENFEVVSMTSAEVEDGMSWRKQKRDQNGELRGIARVAEILECVSWRTLQLRSADEDTAVEGHEHVTAKAPSNVQAAQSPAHGHPPNCDCGLHKMTSLFEMAERRKQLREQKEKSRRKDANSTASAIESEEGPFKEDAKANAGVDTHSASRSGSKAAQKEMSEKDDAKLEALIARVRSIRAASSRGDVDFEAAAATALELAAVLDDDDEA
eukprot:g3311.t1